MNAYLTILSARLRVLLQYRAAAIAGFGTQLFWGFIRMMIFTAFFQSSNAPQPMDLQQTINYIWLGQAFLLLLPWNFDTEVEQLIRTGNVAYELVRPLNLYWLWFCRAIAMRVAPFFLRALPLLIVSYLFFGLTLPANWNAVGAFMLSMFASLLLSSALTTLFSITMFWTISIQGVSRMVPFGVIFFSGLVIPLPFFPDWMQPLLNFLPFRGMMDIPFRVYMAHIPLSEFGQTLAHQLVWTLVLIVSGHLFLQRGLKRVVVQGG